MSSQPTHKPADVGAAGWVNPTPFATGNGLRSQGTRRSRSSVSQSQKRRTTAIGLTRPRSASMAEEESRSPVKHWFPGDDGGAPKCPAQPDRERALPQAMEVAAQPVQLPATGTVA